MRYIQRIIKGDTHTIDVTLKTNGQVIDTSLISKVYLSCKELNLQKEGTLTNGKYRIVIPSLTTGAFKEGTYDYDITIYFVDGTIKTGLYENGLNVFEKHNGVAL